MGERMVDRRVELTLQAQAVAARVMEKCEGLVWVALKCDPVTACCVIVSAVWELEIDGPLRRWSGPLCTLGVPDGSLVVDLARQLHRELVKTRAREAILDAQSRRRARITDGH